MEIQHPSHEHPLTLCHDPPPPGSFQCEGCDQPLTDPTYTCSRVDCKFYLHKSCADLTLQAQIHHPLHPLHPPTLNLARTIQSFEEGVYGCDCCQKKWWTVQLQTVYRCYQCGYMVCVECSSLNMTPSPILKLQDPKHLFLLTEKVDFSDLFRCGACGDDFGGAHSNCPVLFCSIPNCNYALHFHCSPLRIPQEVRHKYHNFHDLVYTEDVVECSYSDGYYYCDACEEPRNPKFPVYACKECNFTAHVHCGVDEMLPSLVEEYENDLLERGVSLDAFLHYFERRVPVIQKYKEKEEARLKETEERIQRLEISLRDYGL